MRRILHCPGAALVVLWALLYGGATPFATTAASAAEKAAPAPHIALLLPLASPSFGRHADAVKQGFLAAAKTSGAGAPPIRVYTVNEDTLNILSTYEQAIETGAQVVVGPLTRNGVAALAASSLVSVPTLALNTVDSRSPLPARLFLFGLGAEQEARQVARLALDVSRRTAYMVGDNSPVSRRMRQAFIEEYARRGGRVIAEFTFTTDLPALAKLRETTALGTADIVFLALDSPRARAIRPYLGNSLSLYGTSQVNSLAGTPVARELNLVHFVEMPWLLQPDHPAVMIYPRVDFGDAIDLVRLYALGIDAFRIGVELLGNNPDPSLDGVTGQIRLTRDQQFVRELPVARFLDDKTVVVARPRK